MDKVFQEEQRKLAEIEHEIDIVASRYERRAKELNATIADFYCVDYEDREKLRDLQNSFRVATNVADQFRGYQATPYFGRLDLDCEIDDGVESYTHYIGKEGITDSGKIIVVDWRSPVGSCYYASNQKEFNVNGINYFLALRRALNVKNGTLVSYKTEYDGETVSLEGDVIDPFLLTVLKDKRRHNRLTDIIRTIQGNQNDIIRKPYSDSFVVQGCAGSGKTMILLHRLSFLKFNNRNLNLNGVKIITPNKYFDAHINELSVELGLTAIERFSVEEYYTSLVKRFSNRVPVSAEVESEKLLNESLLEHLYSKRYMDEAVGHYHAYWEENLRLLNEDRLRSYFSRVKATYPETTIHTADTVSRLERGIHSVSDAVSEERKARTELAARLVSLDKEVATLQSEQDRIENTLKNTKQQIKTRFDIEVESTEDSVAEIGEKLEELESQKKAIARQREESEAEVAETVLLAEKLKQEKSVYIDYDQCAALNDAVSKMVFQQTATLIDEIKSAKELYQKTPAYNFGKRNGLRRQIADGKEQFSIYAADIITSYEKEVFSKEASLKNTILTCDEKLTSITENIRNEEKLLRGYHARHDAVAECLLLFDKSALPDTQAELTSAAHKELAAVLQTYEEQRSDFNRITRRLNAFLRSRGELSEEKKRLDENAFTDDERVFIEECAKTVKRLRFNEISKNVMLGDLMKCYREHSQKYRKTNYRHKLYLKLLYCSLYYARTFSSDYFLNIDEAQDISVSEYSLLRKVLGDKCVFNLYGDINQSVYSYKGIQDWDEIDNITKGNVFVLNENYRNTLQITEFCNKEFEAEVYPIGISGEPVQELSAEDAISWIIQKKNENPDYRAAVIYRHGIKAVHGMLQTLLSGEEVSWYAVDEKKISVLSVETAKGLEFEAVVVIADQMSSNEKYVSYTRALDHLIVVRDKFSSERVDENVEEELDDEFLISEANTEGSLEKTTDQKNDDLLSAAEQTAAEDLEKNSISENDGRPIEIYDVADEKEQSLSAIHYGESRQLTQEEMLLVAEFNSILEERFGAGEKLSIVQQNIVVSLFNGANVALNAPSGSMKSVMLYLLAMKEHRTNGKQAIITAEAHLQENELVLAERLGLRGGSVSGTLQELLQDHKKDKYDVIFVPYDYFEDPDNVCAFIDYFSDRVSYWGLDHPALTKDLWPQLRNCGAALNAPQFLMAKEGFSGVDLDGFKYYQMDDDIDIDIDVVKKQTFADADEKLKWVLSNLDKLQGQGLVYCDDELTCRTLSKQLRKNKIMAEAYVDVVNPEKRERINYLTNSFSNGGLPVLVTTHEIGRNLTHPNIRFILHYDVPKDDRLYKLHVDQIGHLAKMPEVIDLYII